MRLKKIFWHGIYPYSLYTGLSPRGGGGAKKVLHIISVAAFSRKKGRESNPLSPCFAVPVTNTTIVIRGIKYDECEVSYRFIISSNYITKVKHLLKK